MVTPKVPNILQNAVIINTNFLLIDLIKDVAKMNKAVLVATNSAGLTTNMNDLE